MYDETRPKDISILLYRTESDIQKGTVKTVKTGIICFNIGLFTTFHLKELFCVFSKGRYVGII